MKLYEDEKKKLLLVLKGVDKIALTTDMWTSNQQFGYMALTAHFIDKEWNMQQRIINFTEVEPPHTGLVLANVIAKHLEEWKIKKIIISITVDNASSNDVLVRKLKENMKKSGISLYYGGKFFHVRCCAHILNLIVQDGLSAIKDEIISIRDAVKYIKVSPSRLHGFAAAARELDLSTTKKLVLDVSTRWNSTYFMLETALAYKDAFARYSMEALGFVWLLGPEDWEKIAVICDFLQVFYDVSTLFSGSSYATANLYFLEIWRVQEILQEKVENEGGFMKAMAVKMKENFDKYWKSCNLLMIIASILDPRVKLTLSEFVFSRIYQSREEREEQMQMIKQSLQDVYESYIQKN
ncbi:zinc finger BED domain-containing protein RICESLEEPER 2-like [Nymphaea colorata]|nr:zinc finger BED domain-containing protein RICESLEEPER 2-like [Nymphaea colorata]XP_031482709.1 zinc finger BED domain-containing protein RICESLEEPER 2-like [Nymphaea colorata]XP_031482711.1 zinc finger BED domain-containing protein RICESLEEPER 2-like [Nymphaea colorata]XP_031482713.1 zinc finger BED domain-containing protein RICESLEEPER 2-like [Nymphaea colorata]XP_049933309.1 zinc finger BED domain-containing protein RICESLEEPER 2-like [Nymphaea colorata]XP_049933310.1 zinc finger BED doma